MNFKIKLLIAVPILIIAGVVFGILLKNSGSDNLPGNSADDSKKILSYIEQKFSAYPDCPANLSGILTSSLMDPKYISALTPLGNINPPGHTSPVDHIYFATQEKGKIPLYAPADAWITEVTEIAYKNEAGQYASPEYSLRYTVCNGLDLVFASNTELVPKIKEEIDKIGTSDCKGEISKIGHTSIERQCYYEVSILMKSGELSGWVQAYDNGSLPFEIWAFNHKKLSRADIDWAYYEGKSMYPYPKAFCLFDLYAGDLKTQYYSKFGFFGDNKPEKDSSGNIISKNNHFTPRTIEPLCGQINQDITGTIQGMWFGENNPANKDIEGQGKGLAFIHNNIDPTNAEISIGGNFMSSGVITFMPVHSGTIGREFSEVKADGKIYCYNSLGGREPDIGKVLVQLLGDRELKVEYQVGSCGTNEAFLKPFSYYR